MTAMTPGAFFSGSRLPLFFSNTRDSFAIRSAVSRCAGVSFSVAVIFA